MVMAEDQSIVLIEDKAIQSMIYIFRGKQVMVDRDLAELYQVETKALNQAVKRNINRFPVEFRFQLNNEERKELVTNCDRFEKLKYSTSNPYVFTEQGIVMLSAVLKSKVAVRISVRIMNNFVKIRKFLIANQMLFPGLID